MKSAFALLVLSGLAASCDKPFQQKDSGADNQTSACIQTVIDKIKNEAVRNPPAKVYRYNYNGATVYFIPQYCCDAFSVLLDSKCQPICAPDGGISGGGDGKCKDFFSKRTDEQLIWADPR